jgi:hypothetical protein
VISTNSGSATAQILNVFSVSFDVVEKQLKEGDEVNILITEYGIDVGLCMI